MFVLVLFSNDFIYSTASLISSFIFNLNFPINFLVCEFWAKGGLIIIILKLTLMQGLCSKQQSKGKETGRHRLEVEIKVGKQGSEKLILTDISNSSCIDFQLKAFIKTFGLKETAFNFLKEIIMKQVAARKEEIYIQSHSKCSNRCKCHNKMNEFQKRQKKVLAVVSNNQLQVRKNSISIQNLKIRLNTSRREDERENSQSRSRGFSHSGLKQQQIVEQRQSIDKNLNKVISFGDLEFLKTQYSQQDSRFVKTSHSFIQNNLTNSTISSDKIQQSQHKKSRPISTRQRKEAIMTPIRLKTQSSLDKSLKRQNSQANEKLIKTILQSPLFPPGSLPSNIQSSIKQLFTKLTIGNPPQIRQLHSHFVDYSILKKAELCLMETFFTRVPPTELSQLNYGSFRSLAIKYCWPKLQQLSQKDEDD